MDVNATSFFRDNQLTFDVPLARDPTEARRIALDVIARFLRG